MAPHASIVRLRSAGDFRRVRQTGRSWAHPLLVLLVCPNQLAHSRFGIIAGKAVGNAVERNRAKRLLREALRNRHRQLCSGWDVVLIARRGMRGHKLAQVQAALDELFRRSRLSRESRP